MCGIAGWLGQSIDLSVARQMSQAVAHRGPDGAGEWSADGIWLAQRRLSIIDLSPAGRQPMISPSGRYVITFNGEVYNAKELATELALKGFTFRGHCDTEVMLAAVEAWGVNGALQRFNGMFAFGLWDCAERALLGTGSPRRKAPVFCYERQGHCFCLGVGWAMAPTLAK